MQKLSQKILNSLKAHAKHLYILIATFGIYFIFIFSKMMDMKPDGLYIGHPNAWSDWALHISLTNIFANKPITEWFLYHPYYSGGKLTYGFLGHLISGLLMKLGLSIIPAMIIPSMILIILLLIGMYFLYYEILGSKNKSLLAISIFMFSSGIGFISFISDFIKQPSLELLLYPLKDYSRLIEYQWLAGNIPVAMLIPQRAFLIGITIGVWVILLFLRIIKQKPILKKSKKLQKKSFILVGLLAGILPIAHMHSFIAVVIITGAICFFNRRRYKQLLYFVIPAGLLSTMLYFSFIHGGIQLPDFMSISLFWTSEKNLFAWIRMWWEVWGVMMPIVSVAFYIFLKNKKSKHLVHIFSGFFAIFILGNIIRFQPTEWDNTKLFAWSYLGFSLIAANTISNLYIRKKTIFKLTAISLFILLTGTGMLELTRLTRFDMNTHMISNSVEMKFAEEIRDNTKTDAVFLTNTSHNHPINMWASRPIFIGYIGWVRNFGFYHHRREQELKTIYKGLRGANYFIEKNNISYIYVGPNEMNIYKPNMDYLSQFDIAFENENTKVFDTRKLLQP